MDSKWCSTYNYNNYKNNIQFNNNQNNQNKWEKYKKYSNWNNKKNVNSINYMRYSAGILPYTYDLNGNCLFLLGKDTDGTWSDFGGRCENKDNNEEKYTASREFYEETLGSVLSINECLDKLNAIQSNIQNNSNKIISKTLNGSPYYMYIIYIDYDNYAESFHKTSQFMKYQFTNEKYILNKLIEKVNIKWVNINTLFSCINGCNTFPLRNVFLKTIRESKEQLLYFVK